MSIDFDRQVLAEVIGAFGEAGQGKPPPLYWPASGGSFVIDGVFDEAYRNIDMLTGIPISETMPVFGCRLSQFPTPPLQGDKIDLRGGHYIVRDVQPDGHGHAKLMLNLA